MSAADFSVERNRLIVNCNPSEERNFQLIAEGAVADAMVAATSPDPTNVGEDLFADACLGSGMEESAAAGC